MGRSRGGVIGYWLLVGRRWALACFSGSHPRFSRKSDLIACLDRLPVEAAPSGGPLRFFALQKICLPRHAEREPGEEKAVLV